MRSLVEVCAEQRAESWREAALARELRESKRKGRRHPHRGAPQRPESPRQKAYAERKTRGLAMYAEGMTAREVAAEMGVSPETVRDWVAGEGIKRPARGHGVDVERLRGSLHREGRL